MPEPGANETAPMNWDALMTLVSGPFQNATGITNLTAIEEGLMIPLSYYELTKYIPIPWDTWKNYGSPMNFTEWDANTLRLWIKWYVEYHNAVIAFLSNSTSSNSTEGQSGSGANETSSDMDMAN
jgi:hypothetical protein